MAFGEFGAMSSVDGNRGTAAVLVTTSAVVAFDAFSTLMSSPWTVENVGADAKAAASARSYYRQAVFVSMVLAGAAAFVAPRSISLFPLIGAAIANAYLVFLYERAIRRAQSSGAKPTFGSMSR